MTTPHTLAGQEGEPVIVRMADVQPEAVRWLWSRRLPMSRLSLLVGRPGEGKSYLTCDFAARVSTGRNWPDGTVCEPGSVLLIAGEDDPGDTIRPRLDAHGADVEHVHLLRAVCHRRADGKPGEGMFMLADLDPLERALARIGGVRLVVIDPIGSYFGGSIDSHRDTEVRSVLAPLADLAQRSGAAVLLVAHTRKAVAAHADDTVLGSRAFTGVARSVLHLMRDPDDDARRLLLPGKNNLSAPPAGLAFSIEGEPPRVQWADGPVNVTASEILARGSGGSDGGAFDEACDWLRDVLCGGPVSVSEMKQLAKDDGIAWRTLERAKKSLGVRSARANYDGKAPWVWVLGEDRQLRQGNSLADLADLTGEHVDYACDD